MTQENINLLSLSEFYKVISTKTNNVYIAADNSCYLFDNTMDATEFIKKVPNTTLSEIELLKPSIFVTDMYNLGIEKINIKKGTVGSDIAEASVVHLQPFIYLSLDCIR